MYPYCYHLRFDAIDRFKMPSNILELPGGAPESSAFSSVGVSIKRIGSVSPGAKSFSTSTHNFAFDRQWKALHCLNGS